MTLERLHLYILSLVIRLVGVLFLYTAALQIESLVEDAAGPMFGVTGLTFFGVVAVSSQILLKLLLAAYFFLGAPPALRWVQRFPSAR